MPWIITTTLTVFAPLILLYWYCGTKLRNALVLLFNLELRRTKRIVLSAIIGINAFPVVFLLSFLALGRSRAAAFSGESLVADILLVYPFWFGLVITVQACALLLISDGIRLALWHFYKRSKERWLRVHALVTVGILCVVTVYSVIVIVLDTWTVRIVERDVKVRPAAAALAGLRLVHISDVQGDGRTTPERLKKYINLVNDQKPDLILFSGDLVTSGEQYIEETADVMGLMEARLGKIAAVGDHDIFSDKVKVIKALRRNGFLIDDDTTLAVWHNNARFSVTLLTHTYRQRPDADDLQEAIVGADGEFKILLVHQPAESLVAFAERNDFHLFLAGHTHGGGVAFGIPGLFLVSPAAFESRFVTGFFTVGEMTVSVTNGIGMTLAPIRFHAPAQINVLRLFQ